MSLPSDPGIDAIRKYLLEELSPQTRLDYYELTNGERNLLRAMCCCSKDGQAVGAGNERDEKGRRKGSFEWLGMRASLSRKQVQRLFNGYKRNGRMVKGLKARGIVSKLAEANESSFRPAVWRINWLALTPDPEKLAYLQGRMQREFPGMERPRSPEDKFSSESAAPTMRTPVTSRVDTACVIPVEIVATSGHGVQGAMDTVSTPSGHGVQGAMDTVSRNIDFGSIGFNRSSFGKPSAPPKAVFKKRWSWNSLHPGIYRRLKKELDEMADSRQGRSRFGWTPEQIALDDRNAVLVAAARAEIWENVANDLAEETYNAVLERELRERGHQA